LPTEDDDKSLAPNSFNGLDVGPRDWFGQVDVGNLSA
jgi:hypothetical protein